MQIEHITDPPSFDGSEGLLAIVGYVRGKGLPDPGVHFVTPTDLPLQVAVMKHLQGHKVPAHYHPSRTRTISTTSEVLIVRNGAMLICFYNSSQEYLGFRRLETGDFVVLIQGGHSIEAVYDLELLEVKTGPYLGKEKDKVIFNPIF